MSALEVRRPVFIGAIIVMSLLAVAAIVAMVVFANPVGTNDKTNPPAPGEQPSQNTSIYEEPATPMGITMPDGSVYGNVPGNVVQGGRVNAYNDWIYYDSLPVMLEFYMMRMDGSEKKLLEEKGASCVSMYDGWIYYLSRDHQIYKMRPDGSNRERVSDFYANYLNIVDGWMYFIRNETFGDYVRGSIWKMRTDGAEARMLYEGRYLDVSVYGGWIYFKNITDSEGIPEESLCRIDTEGDGYHPVDNDIDTYIPTDEWIFYRSLTQQGLWKVKPDGSEAQKVNEATPVRLNAWGEWIYYIDKVDGLTRPLYRLNTTTSEVELVTDKNCYDVYVVADRLLMKEHQGDSDVEILPLNGKRYVADLDGSNMQQVDERVD